MLDYNLFKKRIASMSTVSSSTKQSSYKIVSVVGDTLFFIREGKNIPECIQLLELYEFYTKESEYKTTIAKNYLSSWVYSPGVAILNELKRLETAKKISFVEEISIWWKGLTRKQKSDRAGCGFSLVMFIGLLISVAFFETEDHRKTYQFSQFDKCVLVTDITGAINEKYNDQLVKYAVNNDKIGVLEMMNQGTVYGAFAGDECMFVRDKGYRGYEIYLYRKNVKIIVPKDVIRPK